MKGLVLAGGSGTRLRPITHTGAKQLVPVANQPVLFYGLAHLAEAGITQVGVVVGDAAAEIEAAVGDGSRWGLDITYLAQDRPLGLAHAVLIAGDFLGDDDFVMYLGDNLVRDGVARFVQAFEADRAERSQPRLGERHQRTSAQILLAHVPDAERFGVAEIGPGGEVVGLVEKPTDRRSDLALVGVYLFDHHVHEAVRAIEPSARGELEITDAIQWLIDHGHRVRHEVLDGWWKDTGQVEPLLEGNRLVLEAIERDVAGQVDGSSRVEGRVAIAEGVEVKGSVIRGPVTIGPGCRIVDSYVGPFTSIDQGCEVIGSEVEHSIVLAGARIEGISRLADSLIGRDVVVTCSDRRPLATRLVLGDHSRADLGR